MSSSTQVRKAAYQSLGAFISTFHIPDCGNQSCKEGQEGDSSVGPLSDSILRDNSLLDSVGSMYKATDQSSEHRYPLSNGSDPPLSCSSTPIHAPALYGSNSETATHRTEFSNFEFWKSPILKLEDNESGGGLLPSSSREEEQKMNVKLNFEDEKDDSARSNCDRNGCLSGGCGHENVEGVVSHEPANSEDFEGESSRGICSSCKENPHEDRNQDDKVKFRESISLPSTCAEVNSVGEGIKPCSSTRELNNQARTTGEDLNIPSLLPNPTTSSVDKITQPSSSNTRLRSSSAGAVVRRVSVESGFGPRQRKKAISELNEGKKRRWSLDNRSNVYNLPQVLCDAVSRCTV